MAEQVRGRGAAPGAVERVLMPGERVDVAKFPGTVTVYPLGVRHFRDFPRQVDVVLGAIAKADMTTEVRELLARGADDTWRRAVGRKLMRVAGESILHEALDLVASCVVIEGEDGTRGSFYDDLPHWALPVVVEAWIRASFAEEDKWRPWKAALERTATVLEAAYERRTGRPISISGMLWDYLSAMVTHSPTSSIVGRSASPTADGPTPSS